MAWSGQATHAVAGQLERVVRRLSRTMEEGPFLLQDDGPSVSTYSGAVNYMQQGMPRTQHAAPATQHAPAANAVPEVAARATADSALSSLIFMKTSQLI